MVTNYPFVEDDESGVLAAITSRRSIRRYQPRPVPAELIEQLLDAAAWAPSGHNRQPWRFAVIMHLESKVTLADAMGQRLRADLKSDGMSAEMIERDATRSYQRITSAPAIVVACITMSEMDHYADLRSQAEYLMATQSCAMAVQNLLLAAHAMGLGACWMCAPLFVPDTVRQVLGLAFDWEPQALITLGYPAEERTKSRKPLNEIVRYLDPVQAASQADEGGS